MMNTKYLKNLQKKSNRGSKRVLELKDGSKMHKTPSPRPIKQCANQQKLQLIKRSLIILKRKTIPFLPHQAWQHKIPCIQGMFPKPNNRVATVDGITHWISNILKTSLHKTLETSQCNNR